LTSVGSDNVQGDVGKSEPCVLCGGQPGKEHEGRQHAYTTTPGELQTPEQKAKAAQSSRQAPLGLNLGAVAANPLAIGRLIEVLIEKNVLSKDEALYIACYGPKPTAG
jgi:hypothetical protein